MVNFNTHTTMSSGNIDVESGTGIVPVMSFYYSNRLKSLILGNLGILNFSHFFKSLN